MLAAEPTPAHTWAEPERARPAIQPMSAKRAREMCNDVEWVSDQGKSLSEQSAFYCCLS